MHKTFSIFIFVSVSLIFATTHAQDAQDWKSLFDGQTLEGWNQKGGKANYEVVDGAIVGTSVAKTPNSFLCTNENYGDFELELEFNVDPLLNSGIQIRSNSLPDYKNGIVHGYQVEIAPFDQGYTAGIYDEARSGWLNPLNQDVGARYAFKQGEWNHLRVVAVGDRIRTWLNGYPAADLIDSQTNSGFIGLQVHSVGKRAEPLKIKWKNIRLRENPVDVVEADQIRALIPAATAMSQADFEVITSGGRSPSFDSVEEKSLTLALICSSAVIIDKELTQAALDDYQCVGAVDPAKIVREMTRGENVTMVQSDRIEHFHCVVHGISASGWFSYNVPELYSGTAHYVATKIGAKWHIVELSMPAQDVFLKLGLNGVWGFHKSKTNSVFADEPEIKKLAGDFRFTEGPAVGPKGKIYFNDIPNQNTHVYDPKTDSLELFRAETTGANGLFWSPAGALFSCESKSRRISRNFNGEVTTVVDRFEGKKLNSPNDICLDANGGFYFTDPRYGKQDSMEMKVQGVYYVAWNSNKPIRVADDFNRPNGIVFSPDFKTLYVADHGADKVWAYDVTKPGQLTNKRLFANLGSDGMSIDTQGTVYLTTQGAIHAFAPLAAPLTIDGVETHGNKIAHLEMPESPSNCLLVGNTLYVTARTGFYSVETNRTGVKQ